jgi:hypothetical protein
MNVAAYRLVRAFRDRGIAYCIDGVVQQRRALSHTDDPREHVRV